MKHSVRFGLVWAGLGRFGNFKIYRFPVLFITNKGDKHSYEKLPLRVVDCSILELLGQRSGYISNS